MATSAVGERPVGQLAAAPARRPFGGRLYLAFAFASIALISAGISYLLSQGSSDTAATERAADITVGRTVRLADRIGARPPGQAVAQLGTAGDPGYSAWIFD